MPLATTAVTFTLVLPDGEPAQGVKLTASLSSIQTDGGIVVRARRDGVTNASGIVVLDLWPNTRGDGSSHYVIRHSGMATEGLRADEFRIAVGETGTANADDLLVDVSPGGAVVAPSLSAMLSHMQSQLGHLSGAQVAAGAVGHVALNDVGGLLDVEGNQILTGGGVTFTEPTAVLASNAQAEAIEVSPGNDGGAAGSILTAWGEDGVYPPVQELRWMRPLIDADTPGSTTFGTPSPWVRVRRSLILSEESFDDVSGNFILPIRANCVRIMLSGDTVLYGGLVEPAFPCRLIVMQPPSAAYSCRFSTPAEEGGNIRWIFNGNTWLDGVQSDAPVFTSMPGGVDIFELTDHFALSAPVYVSHLFSSTPPAPPEVPEFQLNVAREYIAPQVETSVSLGENLTGTVLVDCANRSVFHGAIADGAQVVFECDGMLNGQIVTIVLSRNPAAVNSFVYVDKVAGGNNTLYLGDNEITSGVNGVILRITRRGSDVTRFVEIAHLVAVATPPPITLAPVYITFDTGTSVQNDGTATFTQLDVSGFVFDSVNKVGSTGRSGAFSGSTELVLHFAPADVSLGDGDFSVGMWVKVNSITGSPQNLATSFVTWPASVNFVMEIHSTGHLVFFAGNGVPVILTSSTVVPTGAFFHAAVTRHDGVIKMFINGQTVAQLTSNENIFSSSGRVALGYNGFSEHYLTGNIDQFFITKQCIWRVDFTPPDYLF